MTDRQLRDEVVTLILAGHETTALVLFYSFYLLAQASDRADRLLLELPDVLGDRPATAADVPNLRYTRMGCPRIHAAVSARLGNRPQGAISDCEIGGYHVAKGTQLFIVQRLVHHDSRWFDDPEAFKPERWDNDFIKRLPRCATFRSATARCIGNHFAIMEAVLLLATIARRFRLEIKPGQTLELLPSVTLRPKYPIRMRLNRQARRGTEVPQTSAVREHCL